jgi:predicted  nucleic acid-binding Zn-ribbon protein
MSLSLLDRGDNSKELRAIQVELKQLETRLKTMVDQPPEIADRVARLKAEWDVLKRLRSGELGF